MSIIPMHANICPHSRSGRWFWKVEAKYLSSKTIPATIGANQLYPLPNIKPAHADILKIRSLTGPHDEPARSRKRLGVAADGAHKAVEAADLPKGAGNTVFDA